jgi:hypothetical protein
MGEQAEYLLNGDDDYITGEYIGPGDGYPRTMTKTKWSGRYVDKSIARIESDERLRGVTSRIIQDGFQIMFNGNKFTFFPKNCKVSWKGNWYIHNKGQEVEKMLELTGYYKTTVAASVTQINGTQKCIDHINSKIAFAEKNNYSTSNIVLLKTICEELQQYL